MKFPSTYRLEEIAALIGAEMVGPSDFPVFGMNEIHVVEPGDIVFVDHPKYYDKALHSKALQALPGSGCSHRPFCTGWGRNRDSAKCIHRS